MYIQEWHHGCRVTVQDWIGQDNNGDTPIRIGVESFSPGASLAQPPDWERAIYCPRSEEDTIRWHLNSIVAGIISGEIPSQNSTFKPPYKGR